MTTRLSDEWRMLAAVHITDLESGSVRYMFPDQIRALLSGVADQYDAAHPKPVAERVIEHVPLLADGTADYYGDFFDTIEVLDFHVGEFETGKTYQLRVSLVEVKEPNDE